MAHENSTLPSRYGRYEEVLNQKLQEAARAAVENHGRGTPGPSATRSGVALTSIAVLVAGFAFFTRGGAAPISELSTRAGTVFSAELAGAGASAEEILPPQPLSTPQPSAEPSPIGPGDSQSARELIHELEAPKPSRVLHERPPAPPVPQPTPCVDCQPAAAANVVLFDETGQHGVTIPAAAAPSPPILNVGTRLRAVIGEPVVTSPGGTPVTALITEDVVSGDRVALPAGTRLIGDALAIEEDDRVQVVFTAVVSQGRTLAVSGVVLSDDSRLGLPAKVVKKGSRGKRGLGKLLGVAGSALSYGLIPAGSDLTSVAASQAASEAARDLSQVEGRWTRSDKVLRAAAGPVTVYLRQDLVLP